MEEFDWQVLMETDETLPIPEELFPHVEASLFNGIKKGMLLEVAHKSNPDIYWIAEITMVCGHVLRIKYVGSETDFWCDLNKAKVHPLGWCGKYDELIEPPDEINEKFGDSIIDIMKKALIDGVSVSVEALNNNGMSPVDRINSGMKVEVQYNFDPFRFWIATIKENIGGRLMLHYDGADDELEEIWMFYTNPRLCNYGFVTNKGSPWHFKYPGKINKFLCKNKLSAQLKSCAEDAIKFPTPNDLFQPEFNLDIHKFSLGLKLEAFDPKSLSSIRPATVTKIFNSYQFLVVLDEHLDDYETTEQAWLAHCGHPYIFPIGWASKHKVPFINPSSWGPNKQFDWKDYLKNVTSHAASDKLFKEKPAVTEIFAGMKLEAVNPEDQLIYAASVDRVAEHMLCIELLLLEKKVWYDHNSEYLFPVGWCSSNNHELHVPDIQKIKSKKVKPSDNIQSIQSKISSEEWCDRIYFNYKCYSGPMISRNKLSQLPKHVGPGPLSLVIKEVLNMIISVAYKPAKMLRDWEYDENPTEGMRLEVLKAKLKTSTYHAPVQVPATSSKVSAFCQGICSKLQSCPHLFGPLEFPELCPEKCHQVDKAKFQTTSNVERRGRPKGSKKKKKVAPKIEQICEVNKDGSGNETDNGSSGHHSDIGTRPDSAGSGSDSKKTKKRRDPLPKSDIKTRGAKLPNFAEQIKQGHWDKKDLETIYSNSFVVSKKNSASDSDNDNSNSSNSFKIKYKEEISDVSDAEEPELKKLKFNNPHEPLPSDNKIFQKYTKMECISPLTWMNSQIGKGKVDPMKWTVNDVYNYFVETDDCKILADRLKEEEIDGHALILLDVPTLEEFLHLRPRYAVLLCNHINKIKSYGLCSR